MEYDIGLIKGDGIGPEVIDTVLPLIESATTQYEISIETHQYEWGSERYLKTGEMMPEDGVKRLASHDAILLGAVGHPDVPDSVTLNELLLPIRKGFDQNICKRPTVLFDGVESPLRGYEGGEIDFTVFRENTEGQYANMGGREHRGFDHEIAVQSSVFTREATEKIVHAAFEAALERNGKVTSITKSNAQAHTMVFWDEIVEEVRTEYPNVELERLLVDAACMDLIRRPDTFDVIVASNLFGDIVTDIGAIISGSMGLAPSANIDSDGHHPPMFEPVHGSAPDIVGQSVANPLATVLSVAMLFDHIGETELATALRDGVEAQLADPSGLRTPDLGGCSKTDAVVDDLIDRV